MGGSRGPVVAPGDASSLVLQAVGYTGELKMPPDGKLSQEQIDSLTAWIVEGAVWPEATPNKEAASNQSGADVIAARAAHWAYKPLTPPSVPSIADASWPRNEIDRFVLSSIEKANLRPAPPADKRTLIRRVTFDLTGLPPTPEELEAFVSDASPNAYGRLIERLLASPQYGERWARHWLDIVRYTDSFDSRASAQTDPVEIWRYRDWVVNAFNEDMPYDRFLQYQIAGDLLPSSNGGFNRDGLIATGMLAIGNWPQGDADKQKMVADIVDDQIDVVMRGFLGVTMGCARCHDHKFDPFKTEEYYGLAGIFFSTSILPGPGQKTEGSPILHLPLASKEELAERKTREERLASLRAERDALLLDERKSWARSESAKTARYMLATVESSDSAASPDLNIETLQRWSRFLSLDTEPALNTVQRDINSFPGLHGRRDAVDTPSAVANTTDGELRYATITQPAHSLIVHPSPTSSVGIAWRSPVSASVTIEGRLADADGNCGDGIRWSLAYREKTHEQILAEGEMKNAGESKFDVTVPFQVNAGDRILLNVLPNAEYSCDSTVIELRIHAETGETWDIQSDVLSRFTDSSPWPDAQGRASVWCLFTGERGSLPDPILFSAWWTALDAAAPDALQKAAAIVQSAINSAVASQDSPLSAAVEAVLGDKGPFWLDAPPAPEGSMRTVIDEELRGLESQTPAPLEYAVGIQEGGVPGTEHEGIHDVAVHRRGSYANLGDVVPRCLPAIVSSSSPRPITEGSGRRQLAAWVTEDCAALTARVMVNRIWQYHFGEGLVRTPGDFGKQGQPPTHAELLDYLANEFITSGWSVKTIHRAILNSATYQQSSAASPETLAADPENRLLARMNRRQLEAEAVRDSLLLVSGRLDPTPGGPAFVDPVTPRRTLYLRTIRSNLSTYTMLFDGADPTSIVPKRVKSIVAPQALYLMNNRFMLENAEALAKSVGATPDSTEPLVDALYRKFFGRSPSPNEIALAQRFLSEQGYPAPEALSAYVQVLLSANEFVFID